MMDLLELKNHKINLKNSHLTECFDDYIYLQLFETR